jgi:hypothetical protein
MKLLFNAFLILAFVCNTTHLFSQDIKKIKVGIYIKSIKINTKDENANIDFYYWYRFKLPKDTSEIKNISNIEYINADIVTNEIIEQKKIGDEYYITGRIKGDFSFTLDYTSYPFDKQKVEIKMEHNYFNNHELTIVPDSESYIKCNTPTDKWGLSPFLNTKDVKIVKSYFKKENRVYKTNFGDLSSNKNNSTYSCLTYKIDVERNYIPYLFKFLLPLLIVLSLAYLVFYIPADSLDLACGLTVTSLLAAIAFQWTISDDLPNIGYLTTVDKIFYFSYLLIALAMVQTIWTYNLDKKGNLILSNKLEVIGRWAFPLLFISISIYLILNGIYSV